MKHIVAVLDDDGEITVGHNALAMLARRKGEALNALLKRLDRAIGSYHDNGKVVDEIND